MARERIATAPTGRANRWSVKANEVLTAARVLTFDEVERYQAFAFDCGAAARNLDLPAEESCVGAHLLVRNSTAATHALTVRNDAAGTVVAIPATKAAVLWCDGTTWHPLLGA